MAQGEARVQLRARLADWFLQIGEVLGPALLELVERGMPPGLAEHVMRKVLAETVASAVTIEVVQASQEV